MSKESSMSPEFWKHQKALSQCLKGKPTEGVLMRFNEQEFYLLNLASRVAAKKGFSSRQAWMRQMILTAIQEELSQEDNLSSLAEILDKD